MNEPRRKSYEIKGAKLTENMIAGAAAVMGNLDSYADVIFPGFFRPVLKGFMANGFVSVGHEWYELPVAMPMVAKEIGNELYTEAVFHSTQSAQDARTVCMERLGAGKSVGLSVGFMPDYDAGIQRFSSGADLLAYAEGTGCDMTLFDVAGIKAHKAACWALTKCEALYEYSIVPVPANDLARATETKRADVPTTVREFEALLRDAGYSRQRACQIASVGFVEADDQRESGQADVAQVEALKARLLHLQLTGVH